MILEPARIAECQYLGAGGVPEIFGFYHEYYSYTEKKEKNVMI